MVVKNIEQTKSKVEMVRKKLFQFTVKNPGLFTTVQDKGRFGSQKYGIPVTGALDSFAADLANALVGNSEEAAVLEFTVAGPDLLILEDAYVAITGADMPISLNGTSVPGWSAFRVRPGDTLHIGEARSGCRGYLAVTGGIEVPLVMGSRSCFVGARVGGHQGRPLAVDDKLARGTGAFISGPRRIPGELLPQHSAEITLWVIPGPQGDFFDDGMKRFFNSEFKLTPEANRMGYRLEGAVIKQKPGLPASIISESSFPGGVQIPGRSTHHPSG